MMTAIQPAIAPRSRSMRSCIRRIDPTPSMMPVHAANPYCRT
jgi:hypothetical protein